MNNTFQEIQNNTGVTVRQSPSKILDIKETIDLRNRFIIYCSQIVRDIESQNIEGVAASIIGLIETIAATGAAQGIDVDKLIKFSFEIRSIKEPVSINAIIRDWLTEQGYELPELPAVPSEFMT